MRSVETGETVPLAGYLYDLIGTGADALKAAQTVLHKSGLVHDAGGPQQLRNPAAENPGQQTADRQACNQLNAVFQKSAAGSVYSGLSAGVPFARKGEAESFGRAGRLVVEAQETLVSHDLLVRVARRFRGTAVTAAAAAAGGDLQP